MWLAWVLVALTAANIVVSLAVQRAITYSTGQKWIQVTLIWLLPFFGALVCWLFLTEHRGNKLNNPMADTAGGPDGYGGGSTIDSKHGDNGGEGGGVDGH
jgi:ABC-type nickel/cobalt efflux system permease component RcnA